MAFWETDQFAFKPSGENAQPCVVPSAKFDNSSRLLTLRDTWIVCTALVASAEMTVITPLYVPAERPEGLTETVADPGVVPEDVTFSQAALDEAVQLRVPVPSLYI